MRLTGLHLQNFRKFSDLSLSFDETHDITCFVGENTLGKTNILEAMYFLGLLKSFRTTDVKDLVKWEEHFMSVEGTFLGEEITNMRATSVYRPKKQRKYTFNGVETPLTEYVGKLNVVFFSPDDINLLLLSPSNRRRYLDVLLCQTDIQYFRAYVHYQKSLKQRNALLKQIQLQRASRNELEYWDEQLAESGLLIHRKRRELIDFFNSTIGTSYNEIAHSSKDTFMLHYIPSFKGILFSQEEYLSQLREKMERDLILESTSFGPHRDDFQFLLNEKNIEAFASRGDTRSMILALKLNEIAYIQLKHNTSPLLLLDDVFSELDNHRQEQLLAHIPKGIQTFITSTNEEIGVLHKRTKSIHFVELGKLLS